MLPGYRSDWAEFTGWLVRHPEVTDLLDEFLYALWRRTTLPA